MANEPSTTDIAARQNEEVNLRLQLAKAHYYAVANRWHLVGTGLALAFALVSPLALLYQPDNGPLLGAVAGVWIFATRLLLEPVSQAYQAKGALVQELFDCAVLGIDWNASLANPVSDEEVHRASKTVQQAKKVAKHRDWYPAKTLIAWPRSVLTCQRSNAVWARRQHFAYAIFLLCVAGGWAIFGIALALVHHSTLATYLTTVALPSLPALLDATETARKHLRASARRGQLEATIDDLFKGDASSDQLREIQDQIYELRRTAPPVAKWFYTVIRGRYEEDMQYAAQHIPAPCVLLGRTEQADDRCVRAQNLGGDDRGHGIHERCDAQLGIAHCIVARLRGEATSCQRGVRKCAHWASDKWQESVIDGGPRLVIHQKARCCSGMSASCHRRANAGSRRHITENIGLSRLQWSVG